MKINFREASQIVEFIDYVYETTSVPAYITYDFLTDKLQLDEGVGAQLNRLQFSGAFARPLQHKINVLRDDKIATQQALENYERFDTYYQKAKELQLFEMK